MILKNLKNHREAKELHNNNCKLRNRNKKSNLLFENRKVINVFIFFYFIQLISFDYLSSLIFSKSLCKRFVSFVSYKSKRKF